MSKVGHDRQPRRRQRRVDAARWRVEGYTRPELDWTGDVQYKTGGTEYVTMITDPDAGVTYDVVIEPQPGGQRPELRSLTLSAQRGTALTPALVRSTPVSWLISAAESYWATIDEAWNNGMTLDTAMLDAAQEHDAPGESGAAPSVQAFAQAWKSTPATWTTGDNERVSRRDVLAERYGVSRGTIDRWARAARDHDPPLIEKVKPGRPRKEPDADGSSKSRQPPKKTPGSDR